MALKHIYNQHRKKIVGEFETVVWRMALVPADKFAI